MVFEGVAGVEVLGPHRVRFAFKPGKHRDLPTQLADLPVLSKAYYEKAQFDRTTMEPPLASGPYRVRNVDPGRAIEIEPDARRTPRRRGGDRLDQFGRGIGNPVLARKQAPRGAIDRDQATIGVERQQRGRRQVEIRGETTLLARLRFDLPRRPRWRRCARVTIAAHRDRGERPDPEQRREHGIGP